jgi:hypothetical protein
MIPRVHTAEQQFARESWTRAEAIPQHEANRDSSMKSLSKHYGYYPQRN